MSWIINRWIIFTQDHRGRQINHVTRESGQKEYKGHRNVVQVSKKCIIEIFYSFHNTKIILSVSFRNSQVVKSSKDVMISFNGSEMKMNIMSVTQDFAGKYKVIVSNEHGTDESEAELFIKVRFTLTGVLFWKFVKTSLLKMSNCS